MTIRLACVTALWLAICGPAAALSTMVFVTAAGSDATDCELDAPCRNVGGPTGALSKLLEGGIVMVQGAGHFAPFTVTKGAEIIAEGPQANFENGGSATIRINAPGKRVRIRGFSALGPSSLQGIMIEAAAFVFIENCVVEGANSSSSGIGLAIVTQAVSEIVVSNCRFINNREAIRLVAASADTTLTLQNVTMDSNNIGLTVDGARATVRMHDSVIRGGNVPVRLLRRGKLISFGNNEIEDVGQTTVPLQ